MDTLDFSGFAVDCFDSTRAQSMQAKLICRGIRAPNTVRCEPTVAQDADQCVVSECVRNSDANSVGGAACGVRVYALPLRLAQAVAVHVDSDTRTLQGPRRFGRVLNHTELQSLNERAARIMYRLREHA